MRAYIIEDEPVAQWILEGLLREVAPGIEVCGKAGTVSGAVSWFAQNQADIVFMDVELADGNCFDILAETEITGQIIMITAYDQYAVRAFENGTVDYLLKPIEAEDLRRALARSLARGVTDTEALLHALGEAGISGGTIYKKRILVPVGGKIHPIRTDEIAYFFSEKSTTFLVTDSGSRFLLDDPLDLIEGKMDPNRFFRISRDYIVSRNCIRSVEPVPGNRYRLILEPRPVFETEVSRRRSAAFSQWWGV